MRTHDTKLLLDEAIEAYRAHERAKFIAATKEAELLRASGWLSQCSPSEQMAYLSAVGEIAREYGEKRQRLKLKRRAVINHIRRNASRIDEEENCDEVANARGDHHVTADEHAVVAGVRGKRG